jgi:hypothetical protein
VALLLRLCVRDELEFFGDRLKMLADRLADQVSYDTQCMIYKQRKCSLGRMLQYATVNVNLNSQFLD